MKHATAIHVGYGGLVQRWLLVLLALLSFMAAEPAMARRINGGLAGGILVPPLNVPTAGIPPLFDITGVIEAATLDTSFSLCPNLPVKDPRLAGGTATVNGQVITIPCNTILQMPAFALTWADLFTQAPKDITPTGTGLALSDAVTNGAEGLLNTPWIDPTTGLSTSYSGALPAHELHIQGNVINGKYIAGLVFISQQSLNAGQGVISCIDYATGELQIGGTPMPHGSICPTPAQLAATGQQVTRVRMNDPIGRFGIVHGGPANVGSADVIEPGFDRRFTADTDNATMHSQLGYPVCIPAFNPVQAVTDPVTGVTIPPAIDAKCPIYNRPISPKCKSFDPLTLLPAFGGQPANTYCTTWVMDFPGARATAVAAAAPGTAVDVTDPTVAAPLVIGDTIIFHGTLKADANGPYISAHTIDSNLGIYTQPHTQPAYVYVEVVGVGTGGGTVGGVATESTNRLFWVGFSTDPTELVDFYAIHQDPVSGAASDFFLGTFDPCCVPLGRFRSPVNNLGVFGDPVRNYRAVSRTMCQAAGINLPTTPQLQTRCYMDPPNTPDPTASTAPTILNQNGLVEGQFSLPNFNFIFGENLAFGGPIVPGNFQDLPFLFCGSGPVDGFNSKTTVVGQLDPAPWSLPMADPVFHSTLCPTATAVGGAPGTPVVPPPVVGPAKLPAVISSVTATPATTVVGKATVVTLKALASDPNTPSAGLSYAWTPIPAGVTMSCGTCTANAGSATVTASFTPKAAGPVVFNVTVSNGVTPAATGSATVTVASATAKAPTLSKTSVLPAGTINGGTVVTLSAVGDTNPSGQNVTFSFAQTGGPAVVLSPVTKTGAAKTQTGTVTFSAPFGPTASTLTFTATVTDPSSGLTTTSGPITVKVAATPDIVNITLVTYRPIVSRVGAPASLGKFNMTATSSANPVQPGMTMTATISNNTLPNTVPGSSALPISIPLLYTPADLPGTPVGLTVCGAAPCWVGLLDGVIQNTSVTPSVLVAPTLVTVTSSLGGTSSVTQASAIFTIR